jgi:hypothetical protein
VVLGIELRKALEPYPQIIKCFFSILGVKKAKRGIRLISCSQEFSQGEPRQIMCYKNFTYRAGDVTQ